MKQLGLKASTRVHVLLVALAVLCAASSAFAGVTITSPAPGATTGSPVHFVASATPASTYPITAMRIYVDSTSMYTVGANKLDTSLTIAPGTHYLVIQAWDASGAVYKATQLMTVGSGVAGGVTVTAPASGTTASSPVHFVASAKGNNPSFPITAIRIYLDYNSVYTVNSSVLDTYVNVAPGNHYAIVQAWDAAGTVYKTPVNITVASGTNSAVGVSVSPTAAALQVGRTQQFTASVSGTTNTAVTWKVNGIIGGNSTVGTISATGLYTAPASVPSGGTVTIAAQSVADTTKAATAAVSIAAAPTTVGVSINPTSASLQGGQTKQFSATVSGSSNTAVNWLVNGVAGGNATYGTISSSGLYTAPACPSSSSVTVTAVSAYNSSASASSTVSLTGGSTASNLRYVAKNGSDSNDGSACRPWATIQKAMNSASAGMTILVGDGTYNEAPYITASGTSSAPIVIKSLNKWGARIAPTSLPNGWVVALASGSNYITLQNFEITDASPSNAASWGIRVVGANSKLLGNKIHHIDTSSTCQMGAAISTSSGSGIVIDGNWVYDVSPVRSVSSRCNHMHGMYLQGPNTRVTNNVIFQVWQGFAVQVAGGGLQNVVVTNNTMFNNGDSRNSFGQSPTGGNLYYECYSGTTCSNFYFANNLMLDNTSAGGYYCLFEQAGEGTFVNNVYTNNVAYNCGTNIWTVGSMANTVTGNPLLVNYKNDGSGDYHLQGGSPAVDRGTGTNAPSMDADGVSRPQGSGMDIGAFEYRQ